MTDIPGTRIIYSVLDKASGPIRRISRRMTLMNKNTRESLEKVSSVSQKVGTALAGVGATVAGLALHQRAQTENALGGLASLGVENLGVVEDFAQQFSNHYAKVTKQAFLEAAYNIKSGMGDISDSAVGEFTRQASLLATATKAPVDQVSLVFGKAFNIFRDQFGSDQAFGESFAAGMARVVKQFSTNGEEMSKAMANLGSSATNANRPMAEQITVLGMLQNKMGGGAQAGTAYKNFMTRLIPAGKALKTQFTDMNGNALGIVEILGRIKKAQELNNAKGNGAAFKGTLQSAFGSEAMAVIDNLIGKYDELANLIPEVTAATKEGEKYTRQMADANNSGLGAALGRMGNLASNFVDVIGKALSPAIQGVADRITPLVEGWQKWAAENPGLVRGIGLAVAVLGAVAVAFGVATTAALAFAAANALNPLAWIVAGVTAAVAAIVAIGAVVYTYWDGITGWFKGVWAEWGGTVKKAMGWVLLAMGPVGWMIGYLIDAATYLYNNWGEVLAYLAKGWDLVKDAFLAVLKFFNIDVMIEKGMEMARGLWEGLKSVVPQILDWLQGLFISALDLLPLPDFIKESLGLGSGVSGGSGIEAAPAAGQAADTARAISERTAAVTRAYQESRTVQESQTKIVLDLKNAPGLAVNRVEQQGPRPNLALAGANFGAGY